MKEGKIKRWKERSRMMNLIKEMASLKLETFDGKWQEHDLMDEWMLEILGSGLMDDDLEMVNLEGMMDMNEMMIVDDDDMKNNDGGEDEMKTCQLVNEDADDGMEDAEMYEDLLENELSFMMVDDEILQKLCFMR